jgi:methylated-DNA-[protein]-cysteine S-methyltransferase
LGKDVEEMTGDASTFGDLLDRIKGLLDGQVVVFADKVDLTGRSPFHRLVWGAARTIPYGETRSYAWVARQVGSPRAARAVGQALGANPLPLIVPCHRVVASDGGLGGFAGGLALKHRLLEIEAWSR